MLGVVPSHLYMSMSFGKMSPQALGSSCLGSIALGGAFALPLAAPANANLLVTFDKSTQQMSVAVDGAERYVCVDRAARLRHAKRHVQGEPHGCRPLLPGMGQCADAARGLFRSR